ncbi:MAG: chemotaxis protein CheX [Desulfohalobiaceae bacterium]|nr:chemotaxis protein CheX [Desulfohalobiaceae bacterium]
MISEQEIVDATQEIFDSMIMAPVQAQAPLQKKITYFDKTVSSVVGLAGDFQGLVGVHAGEDVARGIAGSFLESDFEEVNEEVKDALCELANMLAGSIKTSLTQKEYNVQISIPSVIHGDYSMIIYSQAEWIMLPFETDTGRFLVEVQLKGNPSE